MVFADILGFFFVITIFGLCGLRKSNKVKTAKNYLLANRHTGLFALVATLVMTELNTSTLISFSSAGYFAGVWGLTLPAVFLVGLAFYAITVAKKYRDAQVGSVAEVLALKYGLNYARLVSACLILAMVGFSSTYVRSMTLFFAQVLPINLWLLASCLVALVLAFTLRGGLVAIIRTDVLSFILVIIFLPLILYWTSSLEVLDAGSRITQPLGSEILPMEFVGSLMVLTCFTYILAPWYGQKIFSAKSSRIAYLSVAISALLVFALYGIMTLSSSLLQQKGVELSHAQDALPYIFFKVIPSGARGIAYAIIFSIGATTLAGVWSAMASMVMNDFPPKKQAQGTAKPMLITTIFALISLALANTVIDNILNKLILANIPVFALSFSLLAAFYWPKANAHGAYISTISGLFWGVFCYIYFGEAGGYTTYWAFLGVPIIFASGILASLVRPITQDQRAFLRKPSSHA